MIKNESKISKILQNIEELTIEIEKNDQNK